MTLEEFADIISEKGYQLPDDVAYYIIRNFKEEDYINKVKAVHFIEEDEIYDWVDSTVTRYVPRFLKRYFNYESYVRDLVLGGDIYRTGRHYIMNVNHL